MSLRTRRHANERPFVIAGLAVASALCILFELLRELHYGDRDYRFLLWNLFLAWIPVLLALRIYDRYRDGAGLARLAPLAALWLLFLPNAPYILTDFVHLQPTARTPLWLDGAILSAFGWTGLLLGFVSIYLVHAVARHRLGERAAWSFVAGILGLVSAGVCLGRFLRWNSWDLLFTPGRRLTELVAHLGDPGAVTRAGVLTLLLTGLLASGYFTFYVLVGSRLENVGRGPSRPH